MGGGHTKSERWVYKTQREGGGVVLPAPVRQALTRSFTGWKELEV